MGERVVSGAVVSIKDEGEPGSYEIKQLDLQRELPPQEGCTFPEFSFGPLKVAVEFNIQKREFGVTVSVLGISLGSFYESFDKGITLNVNLLLATGSVKFYVKDNALWVRVDVDVKFDGKYHEDHRITSF